MAATQITPVKVSQATEATMTATEALDATDGAYIDFSGGEDRRLLIIIENSDVSNAETVTIKKGDGYAAAPDDYSFSAAASTTYYIWLESARYLIHSGDNKGKVKVTGTADVKIAAALLV